MTPELDLGHLRGWVGRNESRTDVVTPQLVSAFFATVLDRETIPSPGDPAPPGIHWCLAPATAAMSGLGPDGHPARGGFLPAVPLPRRMWAGGRLSFAAPLRIGETVERRSTITDVKLKQGASGTLCFVTVEHSYQTAEGEALLEEQDLVYREAPSAGRQPASASRALAAAGAGSAAPVITRAVTASPTLLFRYSALTFNGHRIHYDRPYAVDEEGYGGLVVHGPLQATLLLSLATEARGGKAPRRFEFRGLRPLIDTEPLVLNCSWRNDATLDLWTGSQDAPNLSATAQW